jgi:hypothetical protein
LNIVALFKLKGDHIMSTRHPIAIRSRNRLLTAAAVFLILALAEGLPLGCAFESHGLMWLAMIIGGALFMAMGIREIAPIVLTEPIEPWYARRHTLLYLTFMIPAVEILVTVVLVWLGGDPGTSLLPYWCAWASFTLFWIAILDWPNAPVSARNHSCQEIPPPPYFNPKVGKPKPPPDKFTFRDAFSFIKEKWHS